MTVATQRAIKKNFPNLVDPVAPVDPVGRKLPGKVQHVPGGRCHAKGFFHDDRRHASPRALSHDRAARRRDRSAGDASPGHEGVSRIRKKQVRIFRLR